MVLKQNLTNQSFLKNENFYMKKIENNKDEYIPLKKSDFIKWIYPKIKEQILKEKMNKLKRIKERLFILSVLLIIPYLFIFIVYINSGYVFNYTFFNGIGITISIVIYLIVYQKLSKFMIKEW